MDHTKKPSPTTGKVAAKPSEGASVSRNEKRVSYKMVLNTCLSFLNGSDGKRTAFRGAKRRCKSE